MRLINTRTFELTEFGVHPPAYAILSHTWGTEEVTFQDMADLVSARNKKGFAKIEGCCRQALRDGFEWAWVDTCCIDKTSSAELSETINSMFKLYERAMKCYAFLSDVTAPPGDSVALFANVEIFRVPSSGAIRARLLPGSCGAFFASRWGTRRWTLQELIAPHDVEFFNCHREYLTRRNECRTFINLACGLPISGPGLHNSAGILLCGRENILGFSTVYHPG